MNEGLLNWQKVLSGLRVNIFQRSFLPFVIHKIKQFQMTKNIKSTKRENEKFSFFPYISSLKSDLSKLEGLVKWVNIPRKRRYRLIYYIKSRNCQSQICSDLKKNLQP
jgi:hypothetical protein